MRRCVWVIHQPVYGDCDGLPVVIALPKSAALCYSGPCS
jgi:hypothetical protein